MGDLPAEPADATKKTLCSKLWAIVYVSKSARPVTSEDRSHILEGARRRNVEEGITGVLFYANFARSGFDRGHLSPNGDMPDRDSQAESFSLANMVAQVHANNAGIWADIESAVRQLALRGCGRNRNFSKKYR